MYTLVPQIYIMVLQCLIADLKLSCMYRVSKNWDRVCIDIHDTRYTTFSYIVYEYTTLIEIIANSLQILNFELIFTRYSNPAFYSYNILLYPTQVHLNCTSILCFLKFD